MEKTFEEGFSLFTTIWLSLNYILVIVLAYFLIRLYMKLMKYLKLRIEEMENNK